MRFDGNPDGMYPADSTYPEEVESLDELIEQAEGGSDVLNYPLSWYMTVDDEYGDDDKFEVVFVMPRKSCATWSLYTHNFDADRAEEWVLDFTKRAATKWYGWED